MRYSAVRWSVLAIAVMAAAGCCYWAALLEQRALDKRRALTVATLDARGLQSALSDTRRALSAMASPGQAAVSWSRQATASIETARGRLTALLSNEGGANLRPHADRLDKLADAEARLRDNAVSGRTLMASDVAFGEALPHVDALDHQVAETIGGMIETADRDLASTRDQQILALAGALGVLGIAAVLLTPSPRRREAAAEDSPAGERTLDLTGSTTAPTPTASSPPWAAELAASAQPIPVAVAAAPPAAASRLDLGPLAGACDALARLSDPATLPATLDGVRPSLGAKGAAVWMTDSAGRSLRVVASSGYEARVVERFPVVDVADDNPTARAFATGLPVSIGARSGHPAAIAVPLTGTRGTTGVLSLELNAGREPHLDLVAAARIVAAQLATLLEPTPKAEAPAPESDVTEESPAGRVELG